MSVLSIPATRFRSAEHPDGDQFRAWKEQISVVFDIAPVDGDTRRGFDAHMHAFHLGDFVLTRTRFEEQRFLRTVKQARSDLLDHYLVQLYCDGGYVGETDGGAIEIVPGTVSILDMGRRVATQATAAECLTLIVPRDVMDEALPLAGDLHGLVLDEASAGLFADYLVSLERRLPKLEVTQTPNIVRATSELLAACVRPSAETCERVRDQIESLQRRKVTRFIDRSLASPRLSAADICKAVGLTRAQLDLLLEPLGGVDKHIRARRALRVRDALIELADTRPLVEIAAAYGFASVEQLTRAFRAHFGYAPSEVRSEGRASLERNLPGLSRRRDLPFGGGSLLDEWIRTLRR